jgi:hypothetical protein
VQQRDHERQHAEMPTVEQQLAKPGMQPRQRSDRQDDGQHEEGAGAEGADAHVDRRRQILRRLDPITDADEGRYIKRDGGEQDAVIDELLPAPLHRLEADAHRCPSIAADADGAGGGALMTKASASAAPTSRARAGQSMRWAARWVRLIADDGT